MKKKTNDYENFEKGMIYMKILKKRGGGSREKRGGGNEIHAHAPVSNKTSPVNSICAHGNINSSEADYIKIHIKKKSYIFNIQLILRYICLKGKLRKKKFFLYVFPDV